MLIVDFVKEKEASGFVVDIFTVVGGSRRKWGWWGWITHGGGWMLSSLSSWSASPYAAMVVARNAGKKWLGRGLFVQIQMAVPCSWVDVVSECRHWGGAEWTLIFLPGAKVKRLCGVDKIQCIVFDNAVTRWGSCQPNRITVSD